MEMWGWTWQGSEGAKDGLFNAFLLLLLANLIAKLLYELVVL